MREEKKMKQNTYPDKEERRGKKRNKTNDKKENDRDRKKKQETDNGQRTINLNSEQPGQQRHLLGYELNSCVMDF